MILHLSCVLIIAHVIFSTINNFSKCRMWKLMEHHVHLEKTWLCTANREITCMPLELPRFEIAWIIPLQPLSVHQATC